ncbi:chitin-binding domain protein thawb [Calliopsis andreniformis]|uniref:chitin-binding domain protein thawb n=1 Tax=Calliopsis andreniformis TaxID=337506 RepID=UPI003FCC297D
MHMELSRMAYLELIIFLCSAITFLPGYCEAEPQSSDKRSSQPEFLSDVGPSGKEASEESAESLKRIVKRLAPEKNGEYQVYQVFFGNADLLKEWLKGAGVTGQPGVDFPALTTIPATSFSCRGLKGGYYADLETNCQVFHICDNGRKISFLCPNGTIFQQSQLICDWWFKVDCSKSTELYEQSSEQLLEEERKRAESRKSKLDYQQSIDGGGQQDYYDVQNLSYDGKQNGRIKTYEEPPLENQVQPNQGRIKASRYFDSGSNYGQESKGQRDGNQFHSTSGFQSSPTPSTRQPFNQFTRNTEEGTVKYSTTQDYHGTPKKVQNYHTSNRNLNPQRDEKGALKRQKFKSSARNNATSTVSQRVTPAYTESTTFRAGSTTPVKESQHFAESAAFVSNRGNRFNENTGNTHQYYYQIYNVNRDTTTRSPVYEPTTTYRANDVSTQRNDYFFTGTTPFDSTIQYGTTLAPPCNDDVTTESSFSIPSTNPDIPPRTSDDFDYRGPSTVDGRNTFATTNYYSRFEDKRVTNAGSGTGIPPTTRSYVTTDSYRQNSITPNSVQKYSTSQVTSLPTSTVRSSFGRTESPTTVSTFENQYGRVADKNPSVTSPGYRQNFISTTTEKSFRTTPTYQQNTVTEKDLSPYDRSFTYKQGKVMSTLGPYIPFTRNYAYTTASSSTSKPTPYSPTVPTYTTAKTLIPKLKQALPSKSKSNVKFSEKEHALSMLNSLKNLEDNVPNLGSSPPGPPAPSTLHSLALYFSTATENFDSSETTDSAINIESEEDIERSSISKKSNGTAEVPKSILTQHTLNSYAELFKLNDAVENNNVTTEDRLDDSSVYSEDYTEDLELQQSGGSLDDLRRTNSTQLRELAQVFTHALSAYLLDPDTFKRVLTEIRPTEPPKTTTEDDQWRTTTAYSILNEDYTTSIREKDEVLDFSDDGNDLRQKLTTTYPTTFEPPTTIQDVYETMSTLPNTYYTTSRPNQGNYESSTDFVTNSYFETSVPTTESVFQPSSTPSSGDSSVFYGQNNEVDKGNVGPVTETDVSSIETGNRNRVGGFQNNSVTGFTEPYGEKLFATTPISDNYVVSPTASPPSLLVHMVSYNWNKKSTSKKPEQQLTPPFFETHAETVRRENERNSKSLNPENYPSTPMSVHNVRSTTSGPTKSYDTSTSQSFKAQHHKSLSQSKSLGISHPTARTSYMKFRNLYNSLGERNIESTDRSMTTPRATESVTSTPSVETTPCSHGDSTESVEPEKEEKVLNNNHWTSSPAVTHLWETSVFVDPQRINHGLESDSTSTVSIDSATDSQESLEYGNTPIDEDSREALSLDESDFSLQQRLSRGKDSPTTFSLLPTTFSENTVTPKPMITTRSSITTTITSSITSTNTLPQDGLVSSVLPYTVSGSNGTENEIAEKLFGKLNASSTNALMRVMKQADSNETVRQLVLLLVRHCKDPVNKTMQREKEELLNALLRLPVNEFASEESKNVVAEINQLSLPATRSSYVTGASTSSIVTEPPITTFRSRKSRKFRTTTENSANIVRRAEKGVTSDGNNSVQEEGSTSDSRALELLRSLYTIATKWG